MSPTCSPLLLRTLISHYPSFLYSFPLLFYCTGAFPITSAVSFLFSFTLHKDIFIYPHQMYTIYQSISLHPLSHATKLLHRKTKSYIFHYFITFFIPSWPSTCIIHIAIFTGHICHCFAGFHVHNDCDAHDKFRWLWYCLYPSVLSCFEYFVS